MGRKREGGGQVWWGKSVRKFFLCGGGDFDLGGADVFDFDIDVLLILYEKEVFEIQKHVSSKVCGLFEECRKLHIGKMVVIPIALAVADCSGHLLVV